MVKERLTSQALHHILEFVHGLYAHRDTDTFTTHLVSALSRLVPADVYSYNELNPAQHRAVYKYAPEDFTVVPNGMEILSRHIDQHPHVQYVAATGDGSPHTIGDFVPLRQFKKTDLYQEFYAPMRIPYNLSMDVRDRDESGATVTLGMHRGGRDFAEEDRSILILIRPHIQQALANAQLTARLEAERSTLQRVMADTSMSVLTLTSQNTILWGMPRALALLEQFQGWNPHRPNQLPPVILNWVQKLEREFNFAPEVPTPFSPFELDCGPHHVRMRLLWKETHRIIVLEEASTTLMTDQLTSLGLSKREAEVLAWVGQGKTNDEIGQILGCSRRTVQKHLEHIYTKFGVENRTAATTYAIEKSGHIKSLPS